MLRREKTDFNQYLTPIGECSEYKGVPIQQLSEFRSVFGSGTFRIRYRGKRIQFRYLDGRTRTQCYQDCIKNRATTFSAYYENYSKRGNKVKQNNDLAVTINGTVYLPKNTIQNNDLHYQNELVICADKIAELHNRINELEGDIINLEESDSYAKNRIEELENALEDIQSLCNSKL
jgi:hypothetical protein